MNRIFLFSLAIALCVGSPTHVFALSDTYDPSASTTKDYSSQCVAGTYSCSCTATSTTSHSSAASATSSASACDSFCKTMSADSFTYSCSLSSGAAAYTVTQGAVGSTSTTSTLTPVEEKKEPSYLVPVLNIPIPGFAGFSSPTRSDDESTVNVNFLAEYINAVYGYVLGAGALVAVVMMMVGGLQYTMARGKPKYIDAAKTRITNAITGMVLLLAVYNIAYLMDPNITDLKPLGIANVEGLEYFPPDGEDINITPNPALSGTAVAISGSHIIAGCAEGCTVDADVLTALQNAANTFYTATKKSIRVTSAKRSLEKQATLFYSNCLANGGVCSPVTCNPSSGVVTKSDGKYSLTGQYASYTSGSSIVSAMVDHAAYGNCPHTSAIALDAWCDGSGGFKADPVCQGQLAQAMISAGFCRLSVEAWHFELNSKKVSTACTTSWTSSSYLKKNGSQITPGSDCAKWDFKNHFCSVKK